MSIEIKLSKKRIPYKKAMLFLKKRVEKVKKGENKELIWILEHDDLYTAGTSYNENEILDKSIDLIRSNRGGKITYHGPGQIICYFVNNLIRKK